MLTDDELKAIAERFVQTQQAAFIASGGHDDSPWWAFPHFELSPPGGAYFTVVDPAEPLWAIEFPPDESPEYWRSEAGEALEGFFVFREDGRMRVLTQEEVRAASRRVPQKRQDYGPRSAVELILTGSLPAWSAEHEWPYPQLFLPVRGLFPDWWVEVCVPPEVVQRVSPDVVTAPRPWWKFW